MINVLVVDDHTLVRQGIISILKDSGKVRVSGSCASGEEAIPMVEQLHPDVVLMDITMNGMTGIEATRLIRKKNRGVKIILVSMETRKTFITEGIDAGIDGFVPKDMDMNTLVEAIGQVMEGKRFFTQEVTRALFEDYFQQRKNGRAQQKIREELTKREMEVLEKFASGLSTREVAEKLFISIKTVETHKGHIKDKLGLKNNSEIILYAIKNRIVSVD